MILSAAQGIALLIIGVITVGILLVILISVHKQVRRVKELEMRMKAMEKLDIEPQQNDSKTSKEEEVEE